MRLRQVAIAVADLERGIEEVHDVLGVDVCFTPADEVALRGPGLIERFRLANAVFALGDTFVELVTPTADDTPIARFLRNRGDGGYMVLVQCSDLEGARERAARLGIREVWEATLEDLDGVHLDPRDTGGSLLSLERPVDPDEWPWAGVAWRERVRSDTTVALTGVQIDAADPVRVADRWGEVLDKAAGRGADGDRYIGLEEGRFSFRHTSPDHPDKVACIQVSCVDPDDVRRRAQRRGVYVDDHGRPILAGVPFDLVATEEPA